MKTRFTNDDNDPESVFCFTLFYDCSLTVQCAEPQTKPQNTILLIPEQTA